MKVAFRFGADAAYLGGKDFSLRSFADNFSAEELRAAVEYAHARGKKVYVTANIFAKNADFAALADYFRYLQEIGADAALVTDVGAFSLARQVAPELPLHVSTQANTTNKYAAKFWQEQGAERVVLARELSLAEIGEIHEYCPGLELEAFVHGADVHLVQRAVPAQQLLCGARFQPRRMRAGLPLEVFRPRPARGGRRGRVRRRGGRAGQLHLQQQGSEYAPVSG